MSRKLINSIVILGVILAFIFRFALSLHSFNPDSHIYFAWMENMAQLGWSGVYDRDVSPATVNYPPLTLYSFWIAEQIYWSLPTEWLTPTVHAALYKVPSLLADCGVALAIWFLTPYRRKWRLLMMGVYIFNPALMYNSVWWGQIEGLASLWCILVVFLVARRQTVWAIPMMTIALLFKQNAAPLVLLVGGFLLIDRPPIKKVLAFGLMSLTIALLSYLPLFPTYSDTHPLSYVFTTYAKSLTGQSHQHVASANGLNWWYFLGLNNQTDENLQPLGCIIAISIIAFQAWWIQRKTFTRYQTTVLIATSIFMTTFTFLTRMHERHIYMSIAMFTLLLPHCNKKTWLLYAVFSFIGWYSLHIVWSEQMSTPPLSHELWQLWTRSLAGIVVIMSVATPFMVKRK